MKKITFLFFFLSFSFFATAQTGVVVKDATVTIKQIPPVWPGCEGNAAQKKTCFTKNLSKHISENFKFPKGYKPGSVKEKVIVSFVVNTKGYPEIKNVKGGTKELQNEATRNIMLIPKMKPGMSGGKAVPIKYTIPFTF